MIVTPAKDVFAIVDILIVSLKMACIIYIHVGIGILRNCTASKHASYRFNLVMYTVNYQRVCMIIKI